MILKKFKEYKPQITDANRVLNDFGAIFIKSSNGKDWYEVLNELDPSKLTIMYNSSNVIVAATYNFTGLFPNTYSIAQVDSTDTDIIGKIFNEKTMEITEYKFNDDEIVSMVKDKKKQLMNSAYLEIQPLSFAEQIGDITENEKQYLLDLNHYVLKLSRLNEIECYYDESLWPIMPTKKI